MGIKKKKKICHTQMVAYADLAKCLHCLHKYYILINFCLRCKSLNKENMFACLWRIQAIFDYHCKIRIAYVTRSYSPFHITSANAFQLFYSWNVTIVTVSAHIIWFELWFLDFQRKFDCGIGITPSPRRCYHHSFYGVLWLIWN